VKQRGTRKRITAKSGPAVVVFQCTSGLRNIVGKCVSGLVQGCHKEGSNGVGLR